MVDISFSRLETTNLVLRRIGESDAQELQAYRSDPEISRLQGWEPMTIDQVKDLIARRVPVDPDTPGTRFQLVVTSRDTGTIIGDCMLHFQEFETWQVEVGITIARQYQQQGYGREALSAIFNYLFSTRGKHRIYAVTDPRNDASIALFKCLGLRQEAHFRKSTWLKGEWVDDLVFAILQEDWIGIGANDP